MDTLKLLPAGMLIRCFLAAAAIAPGILLGGCETTTGGYVRAEIVKK